MLSITIARTGHRIVTVDCASLDANLAPLFRRRTDDMLAAPAALERPIVLDLSRVERIDCSGVWALLALVQQVGSAGEVRLCGLRAPVMARLRETGIADAFHRFPDVASALAAPTLSERLAVVAASSPVARIAAAGRAFGQAAARLATATARGATTADAEIRS